MASRLSPVCPCSQPKARPIVNLDVRDRRYPHARPDGAVARTAAHDGRRASATAARTAPGSSRTSASGMAATRLAIIDLADGRPAARERGRPLLGPAERRDLQLRRAAPTSSKQSATFATTRHRGDRRMRTRDGATACLERMNGDFAFAVWDTRARALPRTRPLRVRPLFVAELGGDFASPPRPRPSCGTRRRAESSTRPPRRALYDLGECLRRSSFAGHSRASAGPHVSAWLPTGVREERRWWDIPSPSRRP